MIADYRKRSARLGTSWKYVPIEVLPLAYVPVKLKIEVAPPHISSHMLQIRPPFPLQTNLGGKAELRMAKSKAGPSVAKLKDAAIEEAQQADPVFWQWHAWYDEADVQG